MYCGDMKSSLCASLALLLFSSTGFAQRGRHADTWTFGRFCRVQWDADASTAPVATVDPSIITAEGTATFSDPTTGELLIYSDGTRVWRPDGTVVVNDLTGNNSSMHSAVIVPRPLHPGRVFVLTHGAGASSSVAYREFAIGGGMVSAVGASQTVSLGTNLGREGFLVIPHDNGTDYWLVVQGTRRAFTMLVDSSGIGTPVVTAVTPNTGSWSVFAASNAGDMLMMGDGSGIYSYDFDDATGVITNEQFVIASAAIITGNYGGAFSEDDSKFYFASLGTVALGSAIYQYDLATTLVTTLYTSPNRYRVGQARLGPDNRVYVASGNIGAQANLHIIDEPNLPGALAEFRANGFPLAAGCLSQLGLPQTISLTTNVAFGIEVTGPSGLIAGPTATPTGTANFVDGTVVNVVVTDGMGYSDTCMATVMMGAWSCAADSITGLPMNAELTITATSATESGTGTFQTEDECGNGLLGFGEACDDSNTTAGDGCSATCAVEPGYTCMGTMPTVCTPVCTDDSVLGVDTGCSAMLPNCEADSGVIRCIAGCTEAAQCNDANECTADMCDASNVCQNPSVAAGTGCTGGVCDGEAVLPMCVECVVDADCAAGVCADGNVCSTCADTMTGAGTDNGCADATPLCLTAAGDEPGADQAGTNCQACVDDTPGGTDVGCDGSAVGPVCATSAAGTNSCVACEDSSMAPMGMDNGCDGADSPVCLAPGDMPPACVECVNDVDCGVGTVCGMSNTCVPGCTSDADCAGTMTPLCDVSERECVECLSATDCEGAEICSATGSCQQPDTDDDNVPNDTDLDDDNDGIPDTDEYAGFDPDADADMDGVLAYQDPDETDDLADGPCTDADADGICETFPSSLDFDADGLPNHLDVDADGDGVGDATEGGDPTTASVDADGDGRVDGFTDDNGDGLHDPLAAMALPLPNTDAEEGPDFLDLDADGDGLRDALEAHDDDIDGVADTEPLGTDTDGDGLDDAFDSTDGGTPAPRPDTDEDGLSNYQDADDDDDGISTAQELIDALEYEGPADAGADVDGDDISNWFDTDSDGDGAADGSEDSRPGEDGDLDDNGILDYLDPGFSPADSDNDGIPDLAECPELPDTSMCVDTDGDGQPNYLDPDDDNDGIPTFEEGNGDVDGDDVPNHLDLDADGDGIPDVREEYGAALDADGDGIADNDEDADDNGVLDIYDLSDEELTGGLEPRDTDGDSRPDYLDLDADGDGLSDVFEGGDDRVIDADFDGRADGEDADGNGLVDVVDGGDGGTPLPLVDTDSDGAPDFQDVDSDDDGAPDSREGFDGDADGNADTMPSGTDENGDGWDDAFEGNPPGNAATLPDTDTDGTPDFRDVDDDGDGIHTRFEVPGTPQDTDGDGTPDYLDPDDDGDGVDTIDESADPNDDGDPQDATDTDGDGIPDYLDPGMDTSGGLSGGAFGCSIQSGNTGAPWLLALGFALFAWRRRRS